MASGATRTPPPPTEPAALLSTPLGRSGLAAQSTLRRAGIRLDWYTVRDLLFHLPRRYDDLRQMQQLGDLIWVEEGTVVSARVRIADIHVEPTFRRRVQRTIANLADETGTAQATWFGRRYIERRLKAGDTVVVSGKIKRFGPKLTFDNPEFQRADGDAEVLHAGRIVPVYPLTAGLTSARLRAAIREALDKAGDRYPEYLPSSIREGEELLAINVALEEAHYPSTFEARDQALERLAFDELLALQIGMVGRRRQRTRAAAPRIEVSSEDHAAIHAGLVDAISSKVGHTIELTDDQGSAIDALRADLTRETPMLRLLQGDVGSGKTAVAAYALAAAARSGRQGALLAPTDLLARQHLTTVAALLDGVGVPVTLLTGSLSAEGRRNALEQIRSGQAQAVIGTHALIQEAVEFADLALVVIDEQHRFGVEQRNQLEAKAGGQAPHVLLMTATPIPRTLGQLLYADLDVSDLRTPPEGRVPIRTGIRTPADLDGTWQRVRDEAAAGHRTFVVVPLIEEGSDGSTGDEASSAVAAETEAVRLAELLAPLRVGLVHGRMKPVERDAEMARFRDGDLDVLVGTTVVEVGVDVPEATMMIVEGADRFGLAQLHQLRGRVGRGTVESFCVLVSDSTDEVAQARLKAVAELRDGFELAEKDFELRREGNVLGLVQSGLPRLRVASIQEKEHQELAIRARGHAEALLDERGRLRGGNEALATELSEGWLRQVAEADPAEQRLTMADAGRVIAGTARGIRLEAPGPGTRPLADRVKQTLFAILEPDLPGARVLDLFAGSGAAGIEALSRGAASATFVEHDTGAAKVIASNLSRARLAGANARVVRDDALRWLRRADAGPFDVVIVDPPYDRTELLGEALEALGPLVAPGGRVVAKHFWRDAPPATVGLLASERDRRFGETALTFYRGQEDR